MPDAGLLAVVLDRLDAQAPADGAADLVLAAFQGADAVDATLRGEHIPAQRDGRPAATAAAAAYLTSIEVEGFRGIGEPATLQIDPGPGLTLVVGRNGSGKSSFSEALEMLLLGTNKRWQAKKQKVWMEGWRNLHHGEARITARFTIEGRRQPLELTRRWGTDAALTDSQLLVDGRPGSLDALGWHAALEAYPPLLSHHELETALDQGPAALHDALVGILGLHEISDAVDVLRDARLEKKRVHDHANAALATLRLVLQQTDDERAQQILAALAKRKWDIDAVERVVAGATVAGEESVLRRLNDLAALPVLERDRITAAAAEIRDAHAVWEKQRGTDAGRALETAQLLEQALTVHAHMEGETCPVCGTEKVLTYRWRLAATQRVSELRDAAYAASTAEKRLRSAVRAGRALVTAAPAILRDTLDVGVDVSRAKKVWERWLEVPAHDDDALALAAHLDTHGSLLVTAVAELRQSARLELERRQRSWRPAAQSIIQWLPLGRASRDADAEVKRLQAAEKWLRDAHDELRDDRFRPIADAVQANWTRLRQDSNVSLGELRLRGTAGQRRLTLDVHVDGAEASALGVMSQGELNCLALALFLPRASLPESPFRFLVIDDPVQAMDPAKVEGLATTLDGAARTRQVVVLTHDTRLIDAVRFLGIEATVIEVSRQEGSMVELRRVDDPVRRYIDDAFAIAMTDGLPPEAVRVIPGFCRMALEAAAAAMATRRLLRAGKPYAQVHEELARPTTLKTWLALALLGDVTRSNDVSDWLQRQMPWAVGVVNDLNRSTHTGTLAGGPMQFIRTVEKLTREMAVREAAHA